MPKTAPDLVVREHDRHACSLPARIAIGPASAGAVKPARSISGLGGAIEVRIVDFSRGGLGIASAVYLPPSCSLVLTLPGLETVGPVPLKVRRATMTDRRPTYYIGASFDHAAPGAGDAAARLIEALRTPDGAVPPEASLA